jgi:hypothetical protein
MLKRLMLGVASGAVGTCALNLTTYLDMAVRGRGASELPSKAAGELADKLGVQLTKDDGDEVGSNRKSALGSLLGYVTGLGVGMSYGLVRPAVSQVSNVTAGAAIGLAAMAASDLPMALLGLTDPMEWDTKSWASDAIPHLVYGLSTAFAYEAFTS